MQSTSPSYSIWSNQLLHTRFLELYAIPLPPRDVAGILSEEFGRNFSRNAVIGRARRLGLSKPRTVISPLLRTKRKRIRKPKKSALPVPIQPPEIKLPNNEPRSIIELRECECRFPVGYRTDRFGKQIHVFCGQLVGGTRPYCKDHHRLVYGT